MKKTKLKYPVNKETLHDRLAEVEKSIQRLKELRKLNKKEFMQDKDAFGVSEHHLRRSLEALLSCGSHILSRIPGAKFDEYSTIAVQLADYGILPSKFKETATKMAKYRNRLVRFYHEIDNEELYNILQNYIPDLEKFYIYLLRFTRNQ